MKISGRAWAANLPLLFSKRWMRLRANPLLTSRRHRRRNIRCTMPVRFPYRIIYEVANDIGLIICVIHSARDDRHWRERLGGE
jgi:hypothetical protein